MYNGFISSFISIDFIFKIDHLTIL